MGAHFIPTREGDLDRWLKNFAAKVAADPAAYHLTAADGLALTGAYDAWHAAYTAATSPATRTRPAVAEKNERRRAAVALVRRIAAEVRADDGVSSELKIGLGLIVRGGKPAPIPPPETFPLLSIIELGRGTQDLRIADSQSPTRRAKPAGTSGLLIFRHVGDGPAATPAQCTFLALATRTEYTARFTPADNGKTATYFARWTNFRGEPGPWSPAATMPIAA